ncbi:MAG: putative lipid II flippase FtsW [Bdellovibrionales bacterium CG10_big_fil_rev_8_21_14_0_10_45_34]|nr:MAG: putative lipid II flippase FtsW [Bdellovibrionales bacterium CG10_big_fil_rev_8_21_14_0_10_45_34]
MKALANFKESSLRFFQSVDQNLFLVLLSVVGFGVVQVYSTSFIYATELIGDGLYFARRQFLFAFVALASFLFVNRLSLKWLEKSLPVIWTLLVLLLVLTFVPGIGHSAGGASRWIAFPLGFRVEPAELVKVFFPLAFVSLWLKAEGSKPLGTWLKRILLVSPVVAFHFQPDFGSIAITVLVGLVLFALSGVSTKWLVALTTSAATLFYLLIINVPYRRARLISFLNPWEDPERSGFQVIQSLAGFRAGGFWGVGIGESQAKLYFLPEAHTDFTLAVLGEELGFVGFLLVLGVFAFLALYGFRKAYRQTDSRRSLWAYGLASLFSLQVLINVGVVLGALPTKGLTLPFLSYGGSSLLSMGILFGLLSHPELRRSRAY